MALKNISIVSLILFFLISCSSSFEDLSKNNFEPSDEFSKNLLLEYKKRANFEALEMHDWNSAKLYSEKALKALNGKEVKPQKINYWKINNNTKKELVKAYENLMTVYKKAIETNPKDLAVAISSLDCWAEQQEENWQTWDIENCRNDYLSAMHSIYNKLSSIENQESQNNKLNNKTENGVLVVTKNEKKELKQIIYFDFDKINISELSLENIKKFLNKNKNEIEKYLIVGHTDTKGTKNYNAKLSLERALAVKNIFINLGIEKEEISILAKGENELAVHTSDEIAHPANRRVEIAPLN
tara:strand:- start:108 stop:1004 length:897 start_codon:yes stop_codon:yes gene_type:complete